MPTGPGPSPRFRARPAGFPFVRAALLAAVLAPAASAQRYEQDQFAPPEAYLPGDPLPYFGSENPWDRRFFVSEKPPRVGQPQFLHLGEAGVAVRVSARGDFARPDATAAGRTRATIDHTAVIEVTGLQPGMRYRYDLALDGRAALHRPEWEFTTFPAEAAPDRPGVWHAFRAGPVERFLLDGRYYRENFLKPGPSMLGPVQKAWLLGRWKGVRFGLDQPLELYDLERDESERRDVAAQNPAVVAQLERYLAGARTPSPHWPAD